MDDYDDYDFESILDTLEPIYVREGDPAAREILVENGFPPALIDELMAILWQMHHRAGSSLYDD